MALGPQRQLFNKVLNMASTMAGEAGGILSRVASSGVEVVGYVTEIENVNPIGIQLHNVEHMDLGYMYDPWYQRGQRRVSQPQTLVGISMNCIVDTNFIALGSQPNSGKVAYLAPSGLITDDASLGGAKIGTFMSNLNDGNVPGLPTSSEFVIIDGDGFSRGVHIDYSQPKGSRIVDDTITPIKYFSPGWARVRINL